MIQIQVNRLLYVGVLAGFVAACSTQTPIIKEGDSYICDGQADYWKEWSFNVGGMETQKECEKTANKYCSKYGKPAFIIDAQYQNSGPYRPSTAKVIFKCATQQEQLLAQAKARQEQLLVQAKYQEQVDAEWRRSIEHAREICQNSFGFKPETQEMSHCLLEMQKEKAAERRHRENALIQVIEK